MKTKLLFLLPILALLFAACEKSKDEPKQESGKENGHEWIDLGLSVKWATCNVGASKPEEYGDYFAWGETSPKSSYDYSTYFDTKDGGSTFIKYNNEGGKTSLELEDDAAHVNWGGNWRIPTKAEQDELRNNCTWTWTTQNGVMGCLVTSKKNSNSIFLPAGGAYENSSLVVVGLYGYYWPSSLVSYFSGFAYCFDFYSDRVDLSCSDRYYGRSVRAVCQ